MTKIYVVLSADGQSIETYFGTSAQDIAVWPNVTEIDSSSEIYDTYYASMETKGMSYGMVQPD
ncbi:hypothetical protein U9837_22765 [Escherichia coli]|nr:hypothetical protein [Escherichia coli]HCO7770658.1 hypothetical protein [Escherichia coli]HCO8623111.1 hypothetical protein [Escherichia coli]